MLIVSQHCHSYLNNNADKGNSYAFKISEDYDN